MESKGKRTKIKPNVLVRFDVNGRGNFEYTNDLGEIVEMTTDDVERVALFAKWNKTSYYLNWLKKIRGLKC